MSAHYMRTISRQLCEIHRGFNQTGARVGRALARRFAEDACSLGQVLVIWQRRCNQRRQLARMETRSLADMGMSRAHANREATKPFWRA